jgi:hypothetical protein
VLALRSNAARTDLAPLMVTRHVPVPLQAPVHPAKAEPDAGDGVRVTRVPDTKAWAQSEPHLMPAGEEVTVPLPAFATVRL